MNKPASKELATQVRHDVAARVKADLRRDVRRKVRRSARRIGGRIALFGFLAFAVTFAIYMFNLENKLIYYVIYPFLQKHYNSQTRNRKI